MEFRILGPLEIREGVRPLDLGGPKPRMLLATLLVHRGEVVSTDRLVDDVWGDRPPRSAPHLLHVYVSSLRKIIGERLVTRAPGYALDIGRRELDAMRFEELLDRGKRALATSDPAAAADALREALGLWRGPALADFTYEPFAQAEIARLEELRVVAREERIEAELALGRELELIPELESLVVEHRLRERPRGQLMLALYRAGRQADALEVFGETRRLLIDELGIEPGPALRQLQQAILRQDADLALREREEVGAPGRAARKLVTVLVADLVEADKPGGGDPELRARELDALTTTLGLHGAAVRRLGETLVATFGADVGREDDARRAANAAVELAERAPIRVGVETGEVVMEGATLTGEPMTTAGRLSRSARRGEALLGETAYGLVRHAVITDPVQDGGRRLLAVLPEEPAIARRLDAPFVGRRRELAQLRSAVDRAADAKRLELVAVVGDPGVGKSRLVEEFVRALGERVTVVVGRCIPYGDGITYWPLREIVRETAGGETETEVARLLAGDADGTEVARRVTAAITPKSTASATSRGETFWAFRRLLEALARDRTLVVVIEDAHWAERTLLELIEYLADRSRGASIVTLCLARPELYETWSIDPALRPNAASLAVEPLPDASSSELLDGLLGDAQLPRDARARLVDAAEGNPLFLEQLLAALLEEGRSGDDIGLPPTIRAVLSARIDRLGPAERELIKGAAVVGRRFAPAAVAALLTEDAHPSLARHLEMLIRRGFLRRAGQFVEFRHALIGDAAYRSILKRRRAELHERLAEWLEAEGAELEEIVGHHLEQAFRYLEELRALDWHARKLAEEAAKRLAAGGRRAIARDDMPSASNLLGRAEALLPSTDPLRLQLLPDLVFALREAAEIERAAELSVEAVELAQAALDRRVEANARIQLAHVRLMRDRNGAVDRAHEEAARTLEFFREVGDDDGQAQALYLTAVALRLQGRQTARKQVLEEALEHASRAQNRRLEARIRDGLGGVHNYGPSTVDELLAYGQSSLEWARRNRDRFQEADALAHGFGRPLAMLGRFDEARRHVNEARAIAEDLGLVMYIAGVASAAGYVEMLAGDARAAERELRIGYELVDRSEMQGSYFGMAVRDELAGALYALGRYGEARLLNEESERRAPADDVQAQVLWRSLRAKLLAREGRLTAAQELAGEAVRLVEQTEFVLVHAGALIDLAEVLSLSGRDQDAAAALEQSRALYELKGDRVSAERARAAAVSVLEPA